MTARLLLAVAAFRRRNPYPKHDTVITNGRQILTDLLTAFLILVAFFMLLVTVGLLCMGSAR